MSEAHAEACSCRKKRATGKSCIGLIASASCPVPSLSWQHSPDAQGSGKLGEDARYEDANGTASDQAVRRLRLDRGPRLAGRPSASSRCARPARRTRACSIAPSRRPSAVTSCSTAARSTGSSRASCRCASRSLDIVEGSKDDGTPCCLLILKNELVPVRPVPRRALPGLALSRAGRGPGDLKRGAGDGIVAMPPKMRKQLAELGLL